MTERRARIAEFGSLAACVAVLLVIFVPWVRAGVLEESDTVIGIEIPVLGWSTVVMAALTLAASGAALALRNRWLWSIQAVLAALMVTGATLVLSTFDVLDGAVLGWVLKALPESARSTAPQLEATFMLWFGYSAALVATSLGAFAVVARTILEDDEVHEDEVFIVAGSMTETWSVMSPTPTIDLPPSPWDSPSPSDMPTSPWDQR